MNEDKLMVDWSSDDDEIEILSSVSARDPDTTARNCELSTSGTKISDRFLEMGYPAEVVLKAIDEHGEGDEDAILNAILTYMALDKLPDEENHISNDPRGSESANINHDEDRTDGNSSQECKSSTSCTKMSDRFLEMGYPSEAVFKAINEHGEGDEDAILNAILTYMAVGNLPEEENHISNDICGSESADINHKYEMSYIEIMNLLEDMGYQYEEALAAIDKCGLETPIAELVEFIDATSMAEEDDLQGHALSNGTAECRSQLRKVKKQKLSRDERRTISIVPPQPMIGFGVPNGPIVTLQRDIPVGVKGPPYFYYENVAMTLKGVWDNITRFLYEIEPEFVDSIHFCAAARKRGYIHNLPIGGRFPILPNPPSTIHEALPLTTRWWPKWDQRTKLNCICTHHGSAEDAKKIREELGNSGDDPPEHVRKYVLYLCRRYNYVWVGKNKVAPLEPGEIEAIMGYPKHHTRGRSNAERYKCLGNSFQVDTVAYHLSVLKKLFPDGINVLSLFSGIGGAEVALHRLGIPLNLVVSVESSDICRNILQSWWEQSNQKGRLIHISDVRDVTLNRLKQLMDTCQRFDLVIGGSPCTNLAGKNRFSRDGLYGDESSLFFEYIRILDLVKKITQDRTHD